jgi:hypothetical protein
MEISLVVHAPMMLGDTPKKINTTGLNNTAKNSDDDNLLMLEQKA